MAYQSLFWEDVEEGQELPPITYEVSLLRLVSFVRATGVYDYVHFDGDYARSVGARDAFISTAHVSGLFSRLLTDWSGPEADVQALSFSMLTQSCRNDILRVTGRVGKKYRNEQGDYLVDVVDLNIGHELAPKAATGSATMVFPSRAGGPVKPPERAAEKPVHPPHPEMPEFAKPLIGTKKEGARLPARSLTRDEIHLWCECFEDWNPLYWDEDYAGRSRHKGIIAPYGSYFSGAGSSVNAGIGYLKPGVEVPEPVRQGLGGMPLLQALRQRLVEGMTAFSLPGFPETVNGGSRGDYYKPVRPGDYLHSVVELADCSPLKRTKLGSGHFVTSIESHFNQREELARTVTQSLFVYRIGS